MGTPLELSPGLTEPMLHHGSGLRNRCYSTVLRSDNDAVCASQALGGVAGASVTDWTPLTVVANPRLEWPSTLVAQVAQTSAVNATVRLRVRGFDQFGSVIEETTPTVMLVNKTNNFVYLAKVFAFINSVEYQSTALDIADDTIVVGTRFDWVRTIDATNEHLAGRNLGIGFPLWLNRVPAGSQRSDNIRMSHDPDGPANVFATAVLTISATAGVAATGVLTATALADGDTITIDGHIYTLQNTLTAVWGSVKRSGTLATDIATLQKAINGTGVPGVDYSPATTAHASVTCTAITATTLTVTAKVAGTVGNTIPTTETSATASWGGATLSGGVNAVGISNAETVTIDGKVYTWKTTLTAADGDVLIGATVTDSLSNLRAAINLSTGAGTVYGANTTVHGTVRSTLSTATTLTIQAKEPGSLGNTITLAETMAVGAWGPSTTLMTGGVSDHREVVGFIVREITSTAANAGPVVVAPGDFEISAAAIGWESSLEKIALLRAAAVSLWLFGDTYRVDILVRTED